MDLLPRPNLYPMAARKRNLTEVLAIDEIERKETAYLYAWQTK